MEWTWRSQLDYLVDVALRLCRRFSIKTSGWSHLMSTEAIRERVEILNVRKQGLIRVLQRGVLFTHRGSRYAFPRFNVLRDGLRGSCSQLVISIREVVSLCIRSQSADRLDMWTMALATESASRLRETRQLLLLDRNTEVKQAYRCCAQAQANRSLRMIFADNYWQARQPGRREYCWVWQTRTSWSYLQCNILSGFATLVIAPEAKLVLSARVASGAGCYWAWRA